MSAPQLTPLGLTAAEQVVYEALVDRPSVTIAELVAGSGQRGPLEPLLASLEDRGLVSSTPGPPARYTANPPSLVLPAILLDYQEQLAAARRYVSVLEAAYRARPSQPDAPTVVEVVTGARAVRQRLMQIRRSARHEVRCLGLPDDLDDDADQPAGRTLVVRTIYDQSSLEHLGALAAVEQLSRSGEQVRVLPNLRLKFCVADNRLAFLPRPPESGVDAAIMVHSSALLDALVKLFDALWQRALPLQPPPTRLAPNGQAPGLDRQRIINLLLSGLTDEAIARQLGRSHRSVQRRVAALMAELGAHTRFQAGAQAALRGGAVPHSPAAPGAPSTTGKQPGTPGASSDSAASSQAPASPSRSRRRGPAFP